MMTLDITIFLIICAVVIALGLVISFLRRSFWGGLIKLLVIAGIVVFAAYNLCYVSFDKKLLAKFQNDQSIVEIYASANVQEVKYYKNQFVGNGQKEFKVLLVGQDKNYLVDASSDELIVLQGMSLLGGKSCNEITPLNLWYEVVAIAVVIILPLGSRRRKKK